MCTGEEGLSNNNNIDHDHTTTYTSAPAMLNPYTNTYVTGTHLGQEECTETPPSVADPMYTANDVTHNTTSYPTETVITTPLTNTDATGCYPGYEEYWTETYAGDDIVMQQTITRRVWYGKVHVPHAGNPNPVDSCPHSC